MYLQKNARVFAPVLCFVEDLFSGPDERDQLDEVDGVLEEGVLKQLVRPPPLVDVHLQTLEH